MNIIQSFFEFRQIILQHNKIVCSACCQTTASRVAWTACKEWSDQKPTIAELMSSKCFAHKSFSAFALSSSCCILSGSSTSSPPRRGALGDTAVKVALQSEAAELTQQQYHICVHLLRCGPSPLRTYIFLGRVRTNFEHSSPPSINASSHVSSRTCLIQTLLVKLIRSLKYNQEACRDVP